MTAFWVKKVKTSIKASKLALFHFHTDFRLNLCFLAEGRGIGHRKSSPISTICHSKRSISVRSLQCKSFDAYILNLGTCIKCIKKGHVSIVMGKSYWKPSGKIDHIGAAGYNKNQTSTKSDNDNEYLDDHISWLNTTILDYIHISPWQKSEHHHQYFFLMFSTCRMRSRKRRHWKPCNTITKPHPGTYSDFWQRGGNFKYLTQGTRILRKSRFENKIRGLNSVLGEKMIRFWNNLSN